MPAPLRGKVDSFTLPKYTGALVTCVTNKKQQKEHSLTFKSRSKEILGLHSESLGIIALGSALPCTECDCPETTIL